MADGKACYKCGKGCKMLEECYCCPWCCEVCSGDIQCDECRQFYLLRLDYKDPTYNCGSPICDTQCKDKQDTCECKCCLEKRATQAGAFAAQPSSMVIPSTTAYPAVIAPIIVLVIVCLMSVFRVRPFHKVRDCFERR
ncbi:hypothetical protein BBBOND_0109240 [Babesia bigemina]|uniref:Uncharacterized protein n=1 Tax=Babesia bigemina TaxID=5866 RepID=A0A061D1E8_BABBI|nr:hypothetical protein BBBOND_0109240 [Babesia bigemina]CDR94626.1 hypothetical protein BBBOND_0109240 [Babesia bigemina]|eukprot:XP_012766812.1 hypothetical protein BBBOND_0109240 [Babesia bigemina]